MAKSSKRQFLVKVDGFDGYWAQKTGGNRTADVTMAYDGGNPDPDLISAPPKTDNISVVRVYDPDRDDINLHAARQQVGFLRTTISIMPTDQSLVATGVPTVYSNALLVGITEPEADASSGDPADWGMEFAVSKVS